MGAWPSGEHRGKRPKGYKRSDERIREDVCDRLSDDDELDASEITVTVKDGEVTLKGTVTDRRAKYRAEDLVESAGGVRDVDNQLRKSNGMLQEVGERLTGSQNNERGGHAGSGTKNAPSSTSRLGKCQILDCEGEVKRSSAARPSSSPRVCATGEANCPALPAQRRVVGRPKGQDGERDATLGQRARGPTHRPIAASDCDHVTGVPQRGDQLFRLGDHLQRFVTVAL